ncbi:hypothetical protein ES703_84792 [subsurface metagenome]
MVFSFKIRVWSFSTAIDSPVRTDSSICKLEESINLQSAGILSPAFIITISPGTISLDETVLSKPSLKTVAVGAESFFNAFRASSALNSWNVPKEAFINRIIPIAIASI